MTNELPAGLRRYWRRYVAAIFATVLVSVGASVFLCLRYETAGDATLETSLLGALLVAVAYCATDHNLRKPHQWMRSAAKFGAAALVLPMLPVSGMEPSVATPFVFFAVAVVSVAGWALAGHSKVLAENEIDTSEVIEFELGARFEARANTARLEVGTDTIHLITTTPKRGPKGGTRQVTRRLEHLGPVRVERLDRTEDHPVPERARMVLRLTPGPALVLDTPDGEWIFPTNQAHEARDVIERRRRQRGRPNLDTFLPPGTP